MLHLEDIVLAQPGFRLTADWQIAPGRRVAVIGPSGAGKSTLLAAIAGFFPPTSGRILWQGQDITGWPPGARPCSILFQDQNLFPHLSIAQNIGLGIRPDLRLTTDDRARVAAVLGRVGLEGLGARRPAELSGGQSGRVALARSLMQARPLLLLDEPFAALGPGLKAEMLALVVDVTAEAGTTVLMVTHDPADASAVADEIIFVDQGVATAPKSTDDFFAAPDPAIRAYLGR